MDIFSKLPTHSFARPTLRRERSSDYNLFEPGFKEDVINWCIKRATLFDKAELLSTIQVSLNTAYNTTSKNEIYDDNYTYYMNNLKEEINYLYKKIMYLIEIHEKKEKVSPDVIEQWDQRIKIMNETQLVGDIMNNNENDEEDDQVCKRKCFEDIMTITIEQVKPKGICQKFLCILNDNLQMEGYDTNEYEHIIFTNIINLTCGAECVFLELTQEGLEMVNKCLNV